MATHRATGSIRREILITLALGLLLALIAGWAAQLHPKPVCDLHAGFHMRDTRLDCHAAVPAEKEVSPNKFE